MATAAQLTDHQRIYNISTKRSIYTKDKIMLYDLQNERVARLRKEGHLELASGGPQWCCYKMDAPIDYQRISLIRYTYMCRMTCEQPIYTACCYDHQGRDVPK